MKKLITLLLTVFSLHLSASFEQVEIAGASFNDSVPVALGSQQWVDLKIKISTLQNGYIDSVKIYIVADTTGLPVLVRLFTEKYRFTFLDRPLNADSITRRIYITLPQTFNCTKFKIITGVEFNPPKGKFESIPDTVQVTGMEDVSRGTAEAQSIKEINYYNINGALLKKIQVSSTPQGFAQDDSLSAVCHAELVEASCILIQETIFSDFTVERKKIYRSP